MQFKFFDQNESKGLQFRYVLRDLAISFASPANKEHARACRKQEKTDFSLKSSNVASTMHSNIWIATTMRIDATGCGFFSWGAYMDKTLLSISEPSRFDFRTDMPKGGGGGKILGAFL